MFDCLVHRLDRIGHWIILEHETRRRRAVNTDGNVAPDFAVTNESRREVCQQVARFSGIVQLERADGRSVELTRRETELLALFAREPGRILSRRLLLREVWGFPDPDRVETRTVDMHVAKLRKKLAASGDALFETIRGEGYRFVG